MTGRSWMSICITSPQQVAVQTISWFSLFSRLSHFPLTLLLATSGAAPICSTCDRNVWLVGCTWKHIKYKHNNAWRPWPWTCPVEDAGNTVSSLAVIWDALEVNSEVAIYISNPCIFLGYPEQNFPSVHVLNAFYSLADLTPSYIDRLFA